MRGACLIVGLLVLVTLGEVSATAHARLGPGEARNAVHAALSDTFGEAWDSAYGRSIRCGRLSPRAVRCRVGWFIGDGVYRGRVRARRVNGRRAVVGRVTLYDEYCIYVSRLGNCITTRKVRWREWWK